MARGAAGVLDLIATSGDLELVAFLGAQVDGRPSRSRAIDDSDVGRGGQVIDQLQRGITAESVGLPLKAWEGFRLDGVSIKDLGVGQGRRRGRREVGLNEERGMGRGRG